MDFVSDVTESGRRFRVFAVVDDFSRRCVVLVADTSFSGARVSRILEEVGSLHPLPEMVVTDNGPEFTSKALDQWAYQRKVKLHFIRPGKPVENAYVESFNGKFRDECLNSNWFASLLHAQALIEILASRLQPGASAQLARRTVTAGVRTKLQPTRPPTTSGLETGGRSEAPPMNLLGPELVRDLVSLNFLG